MKNQTLKSYLTGLSAGAFCLALVACGKKDAGTGGGASGAPVQIQGSDTMVNLAQAWAEAFAGVEKGANIEVGGGGSGVGIAALINGTIDIATASRDMKPDERNKAKSSSGKDAKEFTVGFDCLAIYVHKDNPMNEISVEQLDKIFAEDGTIAKWSDLGVTVPGCDSAEIIRVSRQSSSGTYEFFREHVLSKKDFRLGSRDMNGSKEVVELVGSTPCAIGYSGMGYTTDSVKMLKVAQRGKTESFAPTVENAQNKSYPIARPLFLYTLGQPEGNAKKFLSWVLSEEGQKIVEETGYVPVPAAQRAKLN
ncbi:MAG: phosphate ABC transporter substrate-binding protein [Limisphaerales bacterium]